MNSHQNHLIDYYEAFETLLTYNRQVLGEYRTHFGIMEFTDPEYCWFTAVTQAQQHPHLFAEVLWSMDRMHTLIFDQDLRGKRLLDVGFGTAGTLKLLAEQFPSATVEGINLNPTQFHIAREHVRTTPNTHLHLGDVYTYKFPGRYNLLYFIESAFHMMDKPRLVQRIADLLEPGGEVTLVDIFFPEPLWQRIGGRGTHEAIFDYWSLSAWEAAFAEVGIQLTGFTDISKSVARHITIRMSEEEFQENIVHPLLHTAPRAAIHQERLTEAFSGYKRLHKLLAKGSLTYGVLKAQKLR